MRTLGTLVIAATLASAVPAFAQSQQDHEAHHPEAGGGAQTQAPQPTPPESRASGPSMMGPGMMGPGMMQRETGSGTSRGMMGGNMMSQSGGMMSMVNMMMRGQSRAERIEGHLAFIRAELNISDAQTPQWNAFADARRKNAGAMIERSNAMTSQQSAGAKLPERLALEVKAVTAHLDALKRTVDAVGQLYKALNDEQKKTADGIVVGPMGMPMGMM